MIWLFSSGRKINTTWMCLRWPGFVCRLQSGDRPRKMLLILSMYKISVNLMSLNTKVSHFSCYQESAQWLPNSFLVFTKREILIFLKSCIDHYETYESLINIDVIFWWSCLTESRAYLHENPIYTHIFYLNVLKCNIYVLLHDFEFWFMLSLSNMWEMYYLLDVSCIFCQFSYIDIGVVNIVNGQSH